ncbi:MAG: MFS transporter [Leptospiraceae bacterium]|nr:MFS transporter [Leptospiraceae bacterium]MCP5499099.1 MFS transporter [Leptospiraceae bacterium]
MEKRFPYWIAFLMAVNIIFLTADNNIISAVLKQIEIEYKVDSGQIGLMSLFFSVLGAAVSLVFGYLSDKVNRKKLFAISVLLAEVPCLLSAYAPDFQTFYVLRILTGLGVGAAFPIVFSMIGDFFDKNQRTLAAAILTTCWGIGGILGILVAGYCLGAGYGWRLPFILVAVPNFFLVPLFYFFVPEPRKGAVEAGIGELIESGEISYPRSIRFSDYSKLVSLKTNLLLFLQGIFGTIPWGALILLVKFLTETKGFDVNTATNIYAVFGIGAVLGGILGGIAGGSLFKKKAAYQPLFSSITTFIGMLFTVGFVYFIPSDPVLVGLFGLLGAAFATVTGANMRNMLLSTNPPEDRGAIFSIFNLTDAVGYGIGQFVAGQLAVYLGLTHALGISFTFWLPCSIFLFVASLYFGRDVENLDKEMKELGEKSKGVS